MQKRYLFYYFFSGFFTLVLQVLWQRKLLLIFGATIYSITILLSVWMLGLALGSIFFNKISKKIKNEEIFFFVSQIAILIYALLLSLLFELINSLDTVLFHLIENNGYLSFLIKFILIFISLLIPTFIIGLTLPLLAKIVQKESISLLYSLNALGSVVGAFITGFIFLAYLGYNLTLIFTILTGIIVYGTGILILKRQSIKEQKETIKIHNYQFDLSEESKKIFSILLPIIFLFSGFSSLSYEILYNRILIYFTGNNTYCFTIIVSIFIAGIFFGSYIYSLIRQNIKNPILLFAVLELLIGLWNVILPSYSELINIFIVNIKNSITFNFFLLILIRIFSSFLLIFVPVVIFGFIFPLVIDIFIQINGSFNKEKNVAIIYFSNSIGSVIGSLLTTFLLIGIFQVYFTLRIIALINIGIFIFIVIFYMLNTKFNIKREFSLTILFIISLISIILFKPEINVSKLASKTFKSDQILYYKEGVYGTVSVSQRYNGILHLKINGVGEVPTDYNSIKVFKMLSYLSFILKKDINSILTIAFGAGITYGSICKATFVKKKINIEICKDVLSAAYLFSEFNDNVYEKYKDTIIIGDGRYFVEKTKEKFDLIVSDSTHPIASDSWVLYTKEFYSHCKNRLTPDGIMIQWLPIHLLPLQDYKIILATFCSVFKEVNLFITNEYSIIVGSEKEITMSEELFKNLLLNEKIKKDLLSVNLSNFKDFYYSRIFDTKDIKEFCKNAKIATEDYSPLQFAESRTINRDTRIEIFESFINFVDKNEMDETKNEILKTILQNSIYYFKKDVIGQILFLDKKYREHKEKNILTEEIEYQYNITKEAIVNYFSISQNIQKFLLNPSEENVILIEKLCEIVKEDNNLELLRGILYYKRDRWQDALQVFVANHKRKRTPDTYRNIVILLKRMNREDEAKYYLKEAKSIYGEKWGKDLEP